MCIRETPFQCVGTAHNTNLIPRGIRNYTAIECENILSSQYYLCLPL